MPAARCVSLGSPEKQKHTHTEIYYKKLAQTVTETEKVQDP